MGADLSCGDFLMIAFLDLLNDWLIGSKSDTLLQLIASIGCLSQHQRSQRDRCHIPSIFHVCYLNQISGMVNPVESICSTLIPLNNRVIEVFLIQNSSNSVLCNLCPVILR